MAAACCAALACAGQEPPEAARAFLRQCGALAAAAEQHNTITVRGRDGWLFLGAELRHLSVGLFWGERAAAASRAAKPEQADPVPAILDFQTQLAARGVALLLVPVPPKAVIYPDFVPDGLPAGPDGPARVDGTLRAFSAVLGSNGVHVLDLTPIFLAHRFDAGAAPYCRQDSHWSGNGCVLAARAIAEALVRKVRAEDPKAPRLKSEWVEIEIAGDLWRAVNDPAFPPERLRVRRVGAETAAGLEPVASDPRSPVVLLGDSHNLVFHAGGDMHATGAVLADQLALEWGFAADLVAVRGSGATPARVNLLRRAQQNPAYWAGKQCVVWCFGAREYTESDGWRKVPLALPAAPAAP
jgi:alginate O-acetyltransferase complex protein AlgJ